MTKQQLPNAVKRQTFYRALGKVPGVTMEGETVKRHGRAVRIRSGTADIDRSRMKGILSALQIERLEF
jgi:hypothetical protein